MTTSVYTLPAFADLMAGYYPDFKQQEEETREVIKNPTPKDYDAAKKRIAYLKMMFGGELPESNGVLIVPTEHDHAQQIAQNRWFEVKAALDSVKMAMALQAKTEEEFNALKAEGIVYQSIRGMAQETYEKVREKAVHEKPAHMEDEVAVLIGMGQHLDKLYTDNPYVYGLLTVPGRHTVTPTRS